MRFIALISGGKDSIYSIQLSVNVGHELVACLHLGRPSSAQDEEEKEKEAEEEEESYMYQTAASECIQKQAECLGVPLILHQRTRRSVCTNLHYDTTTSDELEDLYDALQMAQSQFSFDAVNSGAILSNYQRLRIEQVCSRCRLVSLSYLWRKGNQRALLQEMIDHHIHAVLVRTAAPPGLGRKHLQKSLADLQSHFEKLHGLYQFHLCGEGGEYETLVLDAPLFQKRLVLDQTTILEDDTGETATLFVQECHVEGKQDKVLPETTTSNISVVDSLNLPAPKTTRSKEEQQQQRQQDVPLSSIRPTFLPYVRRLQGGLCSVSELTSPVPYPSTLQEARHIFGTLQTTLEALHCTAQDVVMVHLYLQDIGEFATINGLYQHFFGVQLPPSRSTVAVPSRRRVCMDCLIQAGSGASLRNNETELRSVLHVQSRSFWAPVCVGPYSQVNTIRQSLHFCAGQIGLVPETMTLRDTWEDQLSQCWRNAASVLDALENASLEHMLSCLLYVSQSVYCPKHMVTMQAICEAQYAVNGGIVAGAVDGPIMEEYEDEETRLEIEGVPVPKAACPILVVALSQMPVGALTELEIVASSTKAMGCLQISDSEHSQMECLHYGTYTLPVDWDTGHELQPPMADHDVQMRTFVRNLHSRAASFALVTASCDSGTLDARSVLYRMLESLQDDPMFDTANMLHLRLYFISTGNDDGDSIDDGSSLRQALQAALGRICGDRMPATTVVPVYGMSVLGQCSTVTCLLALQVMAIDPIRLEQAIWIRQGRG